ncbi:MAG: hypothetical protein GYB65_03485, partial [Chloroflexi bacterium]|nr:hypothetical protein [Chloroflexota bacterium]
MQRVYSEKRRFITEIVLLVLVLLVGVECSAGADPQPVTGSVSIDWTAHRQEIDGFGLSAAFRQADNLLA